VSDIELETKITNFLSFDIKNYALGILKGIIVLLVGWWIIKRASRIALMFFHKTHIDVGMASFLESILKFSLRIILVAVVMGCIGLDVTSILTAIGASFIAVGISLKDSLSNFISGIVLVVTKPIHVGDFIEFEGSSGTVIKIEMLFTTLQTQEEDRTVIIPNARLVSNVIVRKSRYNLLNIEYNFEISGEIFTFEFEKFLDREFLLDRCILQVPAPKIEFKQMGKDKCSLKILIWCQSQHMRQVKEDIDKILCKFSSKYGVFLYSKSSTNNNLDTI